jgi:hypothetical protein
MSGFHVFPTKPHKEAIAKASLDGSWPPIPGLHDRGQDGYTPVVIDWGFQLLVESQNPEECLQNIILVGEFPFRILR